MLDTHEAKEDDTSCERDKKLYRIDCAYGHTRIVSLMDDITRDDRSPSSPSDRIHASTKEREPLCVSDDFDFFSFGCEWLVDDEDTKDQEIRCDKYLDQASLKYQTDSKRSDKCPHDSWDDQSHEEFFVDISIVEMCETWEAIHENLWDMHDGCRHTGRHSATEEKCRTRHTICHTKCPIDERPDKSYEYKP